jgi:hypothetical protein
MFYMIGFRLCPCDTVVKHSTHNPKIEGLNLKGAPL